MTYAKGVFEQEAAQANMPRPSFRSGAVARIAGMPVATLRIWEQRYQAVRPITAASGHRLYMAADVERVTLLRRLTQQGHAIGLLARTQLGGAEAQRFARGLYALGVKPGDRVAEPACSPPSTPCSPSPFPAR